jgi:hypothetical protein
VIISASYKTDIPTFYGEWFANRLRAGYCKMVNPYNRNAVYRVPLDRQSVDGFVFWTKNVGPFRKHLAEVHRLGYPFVVQHTINGYPRDLESGVVDAMKSIDHLQRIAGEYGPRAGVWRYDTILITSLTPLESHLRNFERLARGLEGATDEVVVSFAQFYKKTRRNLDLAARDVGLLWEDPADEDKRSLTASLVEIAAAAKMTLTLCSQAAYVVRGAQPARCIDARRMADVAGKDIRAEVAGNRNECECHRSRDIGEYDTCPHGCIYCYAVQNQVVAQRRYKEHDPTSEFLFAPPEGAREAVVAPKTLPLFRE